MHTQQTTNMKKPFEYSQEFHNNGKDLRSIDKSLREREKGNGKKQIVTIYKYFLLGLTKSELFKWNCD